MTAMDNDSYSCVGVASDTNSTVDSISRLSIEATNCICVSPSSDDFNSRSITSPQATSHLHSPTYDIRDTPHSADSLDRNGTSGSPEQLEELCDKIRRQIEYYFSK